MPFGKVKISSDPAPPLPEPPASVAGPVLAMWQRFAGEKLKREREQAAEQEAHDFASQAGTKGRQAMTAKQRQASRQNGRKSKGRKPSRSLAERLLDQKLTPDQLQALNAACLGNNFMFSDEYRELLDFFRVGSSTTEGAFASKFWRRKTGRMPKTIRYLVAKFQLGASRVLSEMKEPKDYIVVSRQRSLAEQQEWERRRYTNDPPCPPRRGKWRIYNLPNYDALKDAFKQNPDMTAQDVEQWGREYDKHGEAILAYLRSLPKK